MLFCLSSKTFRLFRMLFRLSSKTFRLQRIALTFYKNINFKRFTPLYHLTHLIYRIPQASFSEFHQGRCEVIDKKFVLLEMKWGTSKKYTLFYLSILYFSIRAERRWRTTHILNFVLLYFFYWVRSWQRITISTMAEDRQLFCNSVWCKRRCWEVQMGPTGKVCDSLKG